MGVIRNDKFVILKKDDVMLKNDKAYVVINAITNARNTKSIWT